MNWISIILGIICIGFITGAVYNIAVPYESNTVILQGTDFGILDGLTAPFHERFPYRSYDQTIEIYLTCVNGSLDLVVIKDAEWNAWENGGNYTPYYEATNVTAVMTTVDIEPAYAGLIDIIMQTNYGDVSIGISIIGHAMVYDYMTAINSLAIAVPFGLLWIYYAIEKEEKTNDRKTAIDVH